LLRTGFRTLGLDLDPTKVEALNAGRSYLADVPTVEVLSAVKAAPYGRATTDTPSWPAATAVGPLSTA
jgi:UDP-N-acetyl-D-mannosaminuronate dehydrogenase